ncbi:hypothetical protein [Chroococcidiopsis cubana]|nr:hypothetical protein [Chroococcidiopsis cubana]
MAFRKNISFIVNLEKYFNLGTVNFSIVACLEAYALQLTKSCDRLKWAIA